MGEAKRRGSPEERKAQAMENPSFLAFTNAVQAPVDPEKFVYLFDVFMAAASCKMPGVDPGEKPAFIDDQGLSVTFTNIPMNRGLMATKKELTSMGLGEEEDLAPYMSRFIEIPGILQDPMFSQFLSRHDDNNMAVSNALIEAMGMANFIYTKDYLGFDKQDLYSKAVGLLEDGSAIEQPI